jgi:hypothetical protein
LLNRGSITEPAALKNNRKIILEKFMRIAIILIFLCLTACTVAPEPNAPAASAQAPEKAANTEMRDAIQAPIEKAKAVEDQVLDGAEQQKADIVAAGG